MHLTRNRFEAAVQAAIESIPARFQGHLADVEFVVARRSAAGELGLYEGPTALHNSGMPPRITIYQEPHEALAGTWPELVEEVRRTVLHEVGHHFGMDEPELPY